MPKKKNQKKKKVMAKKPPAVVLAEEVAAAEAKKAAGGGADGESAPVSPVAAVATSAEKKALAEAAKAKGNDALKKGTADSLAQAVKFYTAAIGLDASNHVYYSNRAAAHANLNNHEAAKADSQQCTQLNPKFVKGWGRLGAAEFAMGDFVAAVSAYTVGMEYEPTNAGMLQGLKAASAALTQKRDEPTKVYERELAAGLRVRVVRLTGAPEHNGLVGTVGPFDRHKNRYTVGMDAGNTLSLKFSNMQPINDGRGAEDGKSNKVIGIDLGTTNSCVGVWVAEEDGVHICVDNKSGKNTVPSFVAFDGDQRLIGDEAKNQQTRNVQNTIYDAKRIIGQRITSQGVQSDMEHMQFKVAEGANDMPVICAQYKGKERRFSPEEISAMVLGKMKTIAEDFIGEEVHRAVITVPAYFSDAQRAATLAAGKIAGLKVERIINEPTAAALAYGLDQLDLEGDGDIANILIFDMGGGTFDVSVLSLENGIFEVLATGGDTRLGGEDFDLAIVQHCLSEILSTQKVDLKKDERAFKRLKVAAEHAKVDLSSSHTTTINLDGLLLEGGDFVYELTRAVYEKLIKHWVGISIDTVKKVMKDAGLKIEDVAEIVMVGGSTRIPSVQDAVRAFFGGKELCKSVNPDECVAYGAAVQGAILAGERSDKVQQLLLVDVTPLSLGVEVEGKAMSTIIKRNTSIPCVKSSIYTTTEDYQTSIDINIYEGERTHVSGNNLLGDFTITGIERGKRGTCKVEVSFELDASGLLLVTARDKVTGAEANVSIVAGGTRLDDAEVERMVAEAEKFAEEDKLFSKKLHSKNELERLCYNLRELVEEQGGEEPSKKLRELLEVSNEHAAWLDQVSMTGSMEEYDSRFMSLASAAKRLCGARFSKQAFKGDDENDSENED